jgi:hypothetical protein
MGRVSSEIHYRMRHTAGMVLAAGRRRGRSWLAFRLSPNASFAFSFDFGFHFGFDCSFDCKPGFDRSTRFNRCFRFDEVGSASGRAQASRTIPSRTSFSKTSSIRTSSIRTSDHQSASAAA